MRHKIFHTFVYKYHIVHRKKCKGQHTVEPFPFFSIVNMLENDLHIFVEILLCIWCVISITSKVCNCNFSFQLRLLKYWLGTIHGGLSDDFRLSSVSRNFQLVFFLVIAMNYVFCSYHGKLWNMLAFQLLSRDIIRLEISE